MTELICIKCPEAEFLDPKKEICYKTGGLFCRKLKTVVGKYDPCHIKEKERGKPKKGARKR
jgi:hypothetical protein